VVAHHLLRTRRNHQQPHIAMLVAGLLCCMVTAMTAYAEALRMFVALIAAFSQSCVGHCLWHGFL
jgi:hypothetical protein